MLVIITYDIKTETPAGRKRLSRIAKICCNYGQRVQNSVFECDLDSYQFINLKNVLRGVMNKDEDSLRFYILGNKYENKIEHYGCKSSYDPEGVLIV